MEVRPCIVPQRRRLRDSGCRDLGKEKRGADHNLGEQESGQQPLHGLLPVVACSHPTVRGQTRVVVRRPDVACVSLLTEDPVVRWRWLGAVSEDNLRLLLQMARRRSFRRGEVVFHRGDPADSMHLVSAGRFAVQVMTPLGDQATIVVRGPGESFGEMALVGERAPRSATVEALESAETFCIYEEDFRRLREQRPTVTEALLALLANEVRMANERLLEALYIPVQRRVFRRLNELSQTYASATGSQPEIPLTQEQLAQLAGSTRATVNSVLREAQKSGLLELSRGRIRILDSEQLARRAR